MNNNRIARIALAIALGIAGGYTFNLLRLPLPWMLGAMTFNTVAALLRAPVESPARIRPVMVAVLGVMLGSAFRPEILSRVGEWTISLGLLALYVVAIAAVALPYFRIVARYDPVTAYFCAMPGGFNEMITIGGAMGGDERKIALMHSSRVLMVVFILPVWFRLTGDLGPINRSTLGVGLADIPLQQLAILAACAAVGWPLAKRLRLPAEALIGPMLLSAAVHLAGLSHAAPPREIVNLAQLFIGIGVGCRFTGAERREVGRALLVGAGMTALMLAVTAGFAGLVQATTGTSFSSAALAFAPGGLAEMSLVGLALGSDVAYIATHHIVRISLVILAAPLAFRLLRRGPSGKSDNRTDA